MNGEDLKSAYKKAVERSSIHSHYSWNNPNPAHCSSAVPWKKRVPPRYPDKALNQWNVGAVVVGYDLSETGVERRMVLAETGERAGFGEAALKSMDKWQLEHAVPEECRENLITYFSFQIN